MQTLTTAQIADRVSDILRSQYQPLDAIFAPKSVAVIGATEKAGSVGRTLLWNLISNTFGGTVYPINPKRHSILGIRAYPNLASVPEPVDLAVIATPAPTVPGIIRECATAGVKGAIAISAGFKEIGAEGIALEQQILQEVRQSKMRLIGPNCLGVMNPIVGLNATFASTIARPGNVGFISQSGALCTAILDWSFRENVGFSAFTSIGSMLDVGWGDLIYYLGDDPHTHSIVIYMESIGDARSFLSAAREVGLTKPIIVIKAGRTEAAAKAAASHTGALTGSDKVLDAAFRRCGVLRVNAIEELFDLAEVLAKQPRPKGNRLTIVTNAGGPGVLATDALIGAGGELAELSPATLEQLNAILPEHWSHNNPIDILGDADPDRYWRSLQIAIQDPNSDGLLAILTPQAMTDPSATARQLAQYKTLTKKPVLASWMGGVGVSDGEQLLNQAGIFTHPYPDRAACVFASMWRANYNLRGIYETPSLGCDDEGDACPDRSVAVNLLASVRQSGRTLLTEVESKQLLATYGIPTVPTEIATSAEEAICHAEVIGYPVVLKLYSHTITHKTDVGGVQLNLADAASVARAYDAIATSVTAKAGAEHFQGVTVQPMIARDGYELIVGSNLDTQFGPVLLFGAGGQLVEIMQDSAIALPPLNTTLARRMMEQTQIYKALQGVRGRAPVDLPALEQLLVRFSQLVAEQRCIAEIDINPLLALPQVAENGDRRALSLVALDARVVLHPADADLGQLPQLAIRPYPTQYVAAWTLKNGLEVTIRPIRPEDEPLMIQYHKTLSEQSVYMRYFHTIKLSQRIAHERLTRLCFIDYDREMALVVDYKNPQTGQHEILAAGRLSKLHGTNEAEFSMLVSDAYQGQGLGTEMLRRLLQVGRDERLDVVSAEILSANVAMQHVCQKLNFTLGRTADPSVVRAELRL